MEDSLRWLEAHPGLAGWVQAFGAVVALFVAILLNRADARERSIDRDARARNAGILLKPIFLAFREELASALGEIDRGVFLGSAGPFEEGDDRFGESIICYGIAGIVSPPKALSDNHHAIAELGKAAKAAMSAYLRMKELDAEFRHHYIEPIGEFNYDDAAQNEKTVALMRDCVNAIDRAVAKVDALYT